MPASGTEKPSDLQRALGTLRPAEKLQSAAAPVSTWVRPLLTAATAFSESYGEHLNHHCARCTAAWKALRDALEAAPPL